MSCCWPSYGADEEADLAGGALSEHFAELPELEKRDRRVAAEVLLGLGRERDEPRVVVPEVREVRGGSAPQGWLKRVVALASRDISRPRALASCRSRADSQRPGSLRSERRSR
jgi:hypothetical protein